MKKKRGLGKPFKKGHPGGGGAGKKGKKYSLPELAELSKTEILETLYTTSRMKFREFEKLLQKIKNKDYPENLSVHEFALYSAMSKDIIKFLEILHNKILPKELEPQKILTVEINLNGNHESTDSQL